jgi:hypothetical protein
MNPTLVCLLMRLYPRPWRERYGTEFAAVLEAGTGGLRTSANVVWAALRERILPTPGLTTRPSGFRTWCLRAPWAIFALGPVFCLAGAYFVACLILWSGWKLFLPGTDSPFVPRIEGFAIFYFGVGRLLYFGAPLLIGWAIVAVAALQRLKPIWPVIGLVLIALISGTAQVHASRPVPGGVEHISMKFALGSLLSHTWVFLSLTALPYLIWQLHKRRSLST